MFPPGYNVYTRCRCCLQWYSPKGAGSNRLAVLWRIILWWWSCAGVPGMVEHKKKCCFHCVSWQPNKWTKGTLWQVKTVHLSSIGHFQTSQLFLGLHLEWFAWLALIASTSTLARNYEDVYNDPGSPFQRRTSKGTMVLAKVDGQRKLLMHGG